MDKLKPCNSEKDKSTRQNIKIGLKSQRRPIETFRTAPQASGFALANLGASALVTEVTCSVALTQLDLRTQLAALVIGGGIAINRAVRGVKDIGDIGSRVFHRNRVQRQLERPNHQERVMEIMLSTWCDRQTTIVACENVGGQELATRYKQMIETNKPDLHLSRVPHI